MSVDCIVGNKWIILGAIAIVLVALIILIVGVSVNREPPQPVILLDKDVTVYGLLCGQAVGTWELNNTVAVFKVCYALPLAAVSTASRNSGFI